MGIYFSNTISQKEEISKKNKHLVQTCNELIIRLIINTVNGAKKIQTKQKLEDREQNTCRLVV